MNNNHSDKHSTSGEVGSAERVGSNSSARVPRMSSRPALAWLSGGESGASRAGRRRFRVRPACGNRCQFHATPVAGPGPASGFIRKVVVTI
jgi:hypothetical protein